LGRAVPPSIHHQPDTEQVHARFDRILDALGEELPAIAEHLETDRTCIGTERLEQLR
jgi:putative transposase